MVKRLWLPFAWFGMLVCVLVAAGALGVFFAPPSQSDTVTIPNAFFAGQVADPSAVNANFTALANAINGKLDNDNWDPSGPDLQCSNIDTTSACVNSTYIIDGQVQNADLANNSVNTNKIIDESILSADIFDSTIASVDILDGSVGTSDLAVNAATIPTTDSSIAGFSFNCPASIGDLSGASWNISLSQNAIGMITVQGTMLPTTGSSTVQLDLVVDGVTRQTKTFVWGGVQNDTQGFTFITTLSLLSGSRVVKLQCTDAAAGALTWGTFYLNFVEFKR